MKCLQQASQEEDMPPDHEQLQDLCPATKVKVMERQRGFQAQSADVSPRLVHGMGSRLQPRGASAFGRAEEVTNGSKKPRSISSPGTPEGGSLPEFSGNASFLGRPRAGSNRTADTESEAGDNASVEFVMAGDLTKSGRPKRPSLRRMFTSSIFHSRGFFSQKSTDIKDSDFISQNMHWLWTQALLLQTMFFNMDHDRLIDHVKDFVSVLLAHNLPKDSRLVQLMALIAHAVSPKYSKIKPNFSTETVEQMEKEMNTLESWDQNYLFGVLYQVTALAFISKGSYDEG
eukprot:CAMPEP_0171561528 /NCGR_PEP_ID=MMETSP0960-20121227/14402_1 /TAXON_ID=87120 /ORGANISM="Aurantiochytrium limacinum, Strain ATCCMYA-1381" /LENGTH=286 /DNA_ID=CAMNT_0012114049 /DNA_START=40 /DNA_END=897 /DNA_ORIENTATION=+